MGDIQRSFIVAFAHLLSKLVLIQACNMQHEKVLHIVICNTKRPCTLQVTYQNLFTPALAWVPLIGSRWHTLLCRSNWLH